MVHFFYVKNSPKNPARNLAWLSMVCYVLCFQALQLSSAMQMCISAAEDDIRMKCMKVVHSMLKEEVDKAQSLSNSSHDKAIKVIIHCLCKVQSRSVFSACFQQAFTSLQKILISMNN